MTKTDLCNLALDHIKATNITSIDDNSIEAKTCKRHYDTELGSLLEETEWNFAEKRVALALIPTTTFDPSDFSDYEYAYAYPSDCLIINDIYNSASAKTANRIPYILNTSSDKTALYILTNEEDAYLKYTAAVDSFTVIRSNQFRKAFSYKLAAAIAMKIKGDDKLRDDNMNLYYGFAALAKSKDAKEAHEDMQDFKEYSNAMK